jgi:hypothetical protein
MKESWREEELTAIAENKNVFDNHHSRWSQGSVDFNQ